MKTLAALCMILLGLASAPLLATPEILCQWNRPNEKIQLKFSFLAEKVVTIVVDNSYSLPETRIFMEDAKLSYVNVHYKNEDVSYLFPLKIFKPDQLGKPSTVEIHGDDFETASCKPTKLIRPPASL